ncbi:hypothetical protein J0S82_001166, partial [Galemys pyrenaicus]
PRILALDKISSPKGTSPALLNGHTTSGFSGNGQFSLSSWKCFLPITSSPRPWAVNSYLTVTQTKQEKWKLLTPTEKKDANKGMSPLRSHLFFKQGLTVTTVMENKKALLVATAYDGDQLHSAGCLLAYSGVYLEDKGTLAKLAEVINTNYGNRCVAICHYWGGNVLGQIHGSNLQASKGEG